MKEARGGQWMKHKGGNEGGSRGAMDETQGGE